MFLNLYRFKKMFIFLDLSNFDYKQSSKNNKKLAKNMKKED